MSTQMIIGQIFGFLATAITVCAYQIGDKKKLVFVQSLAIFCTSTGFLLLGAMPGFALNVVCLVRNVVFYFQKEGSRTAYVTGIGFAVILGITGALSWQGPVSLFIILALMANTVITSLGNPQFLRKSLLVTCCMVIAYNVMVFNLGGILNESLSIVSAIVGLIRHRKPKSAVTETQDFSLRK